MSMPERCPFVINICLIQLFCRMPANSLDRCVIGDDGELTTYFGPKFERRLRRCLRDGTNANTCRRLHHVATVSTWCGEAHSKA